MIEVDAADRVLLLTVPSAAEIGRLANKLSRGILVCLVDQDRAFEMRRELSKLENVMVTPGDPDGTIPWKEEFFTVVYALHLAEPSPEVLRVLAPAGRVYLANGSVTKR